LAQDLLAQALCDFDPDRVCLRSLAAVRLVLILIMPLRGLVLFSLLLLGASRRNMRTRVAVQESSARANTSWLPTTIVGRPPLHRGEVVKRGRPGIRSSSAMTRAVGAQMQYPRVPYKAPGTDYTQWVTPTDRMVYDRIITLSGALDNQAVTEYISLLLYLKYDSPDKKVTLYVNLLGGDLSAGLALQDCMSAMPFEIETCNVGYCGDVGAFIVASGTPGLRYAMPSSQFKLSTPRFQTQGQMQASDVKVEAEQILRQKRTFLEGFSKFTGQPISKLEQDFSRDFYLDAQQAVEYGLIDRILNAKVMASIGSAPRPQAPPETSRLGSRTRDEPASAV